MHETFVVISLRGGVDALNAIIPYREEAYSRARPSIAIPGPGAPGPAAIELDRTFALHPALAPLAPLYERGELAIVHAVGWPGDTHSHFEVWDEIESGATGSTRPRTGWLARYLALREARPGAVLRAVAIADTLPRLLTGLTTATAMPEVPAALVPGDGGRDRRMRAALRALHDDGSALGGVGVRTIDAFDGLAGLLARDRATSGAGAYPETDFGKGLHTVELLLRGDVGLEASCVELGGWDTHVAQGGTDGAMAALLGELASGLSTFMERQRDIPGRRIVVALSEFGRRVAENGSGGTDHGQGGVALVLGGGVRGGRVYCDWPGLAPERLTGPGDLAATIDVRDVLGELVAGRAGDAVAAAVFPGHRPRSPLGIV
jgi:uncharacterized protein (DUF1501 family)